MRTLDIAALALNAALYVVFGYIFYSVLPITAPGLGTVRFWPQVIVPAIFAALFGPWVGGFGARESTMTAANSLETQVRNSPCSLESPSSLNMFKQSVGKFYLLKLCLKRHNASEKWGR